MVGVQKRKIQWAISLFLVMLYFSGLPAQAQYDGGSGEPNDPYLIYTAEQMNKEQRTENRGQRTELTSDRRVKSCTLLCYVFGAEMLLSIRFESILCLLST